ncbi:ISL3 family transposase [Clostridium butyricum]|uniref:ISL3 family transposase n=1 Tax=Clostridium TaxID=1485 RepID=UPI0006A7D280|nr:MULTISPECIES: ISL3 family transposase [Clostridium]ALR90284.1 transposase [Clostridium butyricum]ALS19170.1 transposase [Clostridium butyricum]ANF16356.1 transposase [Clostridium butyricum]AOR96270.1 transposase [Clostridium butyricum]MCI3010180.1 ISL3 family transposase [Clostridium butyricum]
MCNSSIDLQNFFPTNKLKITNILEDTKVIKISLKSQSNNCICPKCNIISNKYHGTYIRKVQDLPILGKQVLLEINSYEYKCENIDCSNKTIVESFDGFISYYSRMTERLSDFLCTLALETSCEGAARIAKNMNIKVSGDTIIKILLKKYDEMKINTCSSTVGIDDFSFKKRHNYGTIIVDEKTHKPIAILDGRDGKTLSTWLKDNKHIKVVTRDRASAYAKVIEQELPGAMQIADRFHIHQNLLQAIKKSLYKEIPSTIKIENDIKTQCRSEQNDHGKKNPKNCG